MSDCLGGGLMKRARTDWPSDMSAKKEKSCLVAIVDSDIVGKH